MFLSKINCFGVKLICLWSCTKANERKGIPKKPLFVIVMVQSHRFTHSFLQQTLQSSPWMHNNEVHGWFEENIWSFYIPYENWPPSTGFRKKIEIFVYFTRDKNRYKIYPWHHYLSCGINITRTDKHIQHISLIRCDQISCHCHNDKHSLT